jgi:hypothetical protein
MPKESPHKIAIRDTVVVSAAVVGINHPIKKSIKR